MLAATVHNQFIKWTLGYMLCIFFLRMNITNVGFSVLAVSQEQHESLKEGKRNGKKVFMNNAYRQIDDSKQNHICRVLRMLSNMVLQAHTSIHATTPVIFIKWHPCQIKSF